MSRSFLFSWIIAYLLGSTAWASPPPLWQPVEGYTIQSDSTGWSQPIAIQFPPNSHPATQSVQYYVLENDGRLVAVNKARDPVEVYRFQASQSATSLCMDSQSGELFIPVMEKTAPPSMIRYQVFRFALSKTEVKIQPHLIETWNLPFQTTLEAPVEMGQCLISASQHFWIGLHSRLPEYSQQLDRPDGKLLRMSPNGISLLDNPFYDANAPQKLRSYIYAYGLAAPMALTEGNLGDFYLAESEANITRVLHLIPGRNYLWDGNPMRLRMNSIVNWPAGGQPPILLWANYHSAFLPWNQHLLIPEVRTGRIRAIHLEAGIARSPLQVLLDHPPSEAAPNGARFPLAWGTDGLYFAWPNIASNDTISRHTSIFRMIKATGETNTNQESPGLSGQVWFQRLECSSCHRLGGQGGQAGPALDNLVARLEVRLNSEEYATQLNQVDQLVENPFAQYREARQKLRELEGMAKVEQWIKYRLTEPRFDMPDSQMPNMGLSQEQVDALTQFLVSATRVQETAKPWWKQWEEGIKLYLTTHLPVGFGLAFGIGVLLGWGLRKGFLRGLRLGRKLW